MSEPTLTFGSVASLSPSDSTSTPTLHSALSSLPLTIPTYTHTLSGDPVYGPGSDSDPGSNSGNGMGQVQNANESSSILPLGPVFGCSALVVLAVVLTMRWKRRGSWRGVFGLEDGLGLGGGGGGGEVDLGRRPEVFDSYVDVKPAFVFGEKAGSVDEAWERAGWTWRDAKPLSAKYAPATSPPHLSSSYASLPESQALTACSTRTLQQPTEPPAILFQNAFTTNTAVKYSCQQQVPSTFTEKPKLRLPPKRLHVTVLISMPTPPPPPHELTHNDDDLDYNNDDNEHEHEHDDEKSSAYETASDRSSVSEISKEKAKARRIRSEAEINDRLRRTCVCPRTADLNLALGIAEIDVHCDS